MPVSAPNAGVANREAEEASGTAPAPVPGLSPA